MSQHHTEVFKSEAVQLALTRGLTRRQVADDLGVGLSTLNKWIKAHRDDQKPSGANTAALEKELAALRKEDRILREEREIFKKATEFFCLSKAVRFSFIDKHRGTASIARLCRIFGVTDRGYRAWVRRPARRRQRDDLVLLAPIREQHPLSLQSDGRPRMTQELKEWGFAVGERRVGRLMAANGRYSVRTRKDKRTTDSHQGFAVTDNLLDQEFGATAPNQQWAGDICYIWTREGWLSVAVILDL